jgi:hypothetical protein
MSSFKRLWRPDAFSALGEGFLDDLTLNDGIHLRWTFDQRLGLPFEKEDVRHGNFQIMFQHPRFPSVKSLDLFNTPMTVHPIRSNKISNPNARAIIAGNKVVFQKRTNNEYFSVFWQVVYHLIALKQQWFRFSRTDK